jgi:hypothetical protein
MMNKLSLRLRLPLLVAGTMLPLILFAAGLVYVKHMRDREAAFERVLETVKSIQVVLDTEMQGITLALEVLANSRGLQNDDVEGFRNNANAFLRRYPTSSMSLAKKNGTQVFNTAVPQGRSMPRRANGESIEAVFRTGQPAYSNLFIASVFGRGIVTVSVPVIRGGNVAYEGFRQPADRASLPRASGRQRIAGIHRRGRGLHARMPAFVSRADRFSAAANLCIASLGADARLFHHLLPSGGVRGNKLAELLRRAARCGQSLLG